MNVVAPIAALLAASLPAAAISAAILDARTFTIPNWLTAGLAAAYVPAALAAGIGWADLGLSLCVGAVALLVSFALFSAGWFGGGDAKMLASLSCWMGPGQILPFLLYSSLAGGGLALLILAFRALPLPALARRPVLRRLHDKRRGVPYGIALGLAALLLTPQTEVWQRVLASFS